MFQHLCAEDRVERTVRKRKAVRLPHHHVHSLSGGDVDPHNPVHPTLRHPRGIWLSTAPQIEGPSPNLREDTAKVTVKSTHGKPLEMPATDVRMGAGNPVVDPAKRRVQAFQHGAPHRTAGSLPSRASFRHITQVYATSGAGTRKYRGECRSSPDPYSADPRRNSPRTMLLTQSGATIHARTAATAAPTGNLTSRLLKGEDLHGDMQ